MMRCAACSTPLPDDASTCTQCGATVYPSEQMPLLPHAEPPALPPARPWRPRAWSLAAGGLAAVLVAGAFWAWQGHRPAVAPDALFAAQQQAVAQGDGPGSDPVCVANGLNYDGTPILVAPDNAPTLAWMDTLVDAGLYAPATPGPVPQGDGVPVRQYQATAALAHWGDGRRLCIARAVRLQAVRRLGAVQPMRVRGEAFSGVSADVEWTLDQPAPWLQMTGVAEALAAQLPAWRGARWQATQGAWTLVQRRHFFFKDGHWHTAEMLESGHGLPPRPAIPGS